VLQFLGLGLSSFRFYEFKTTSCVYFYVILRRVGEYVGPYTTCMVRNEEGQCK